MRELFFALDENNGRPLIELANGVSVLIDTGAIIPVWCASEELLKERYKCKYIKKNVSFKGYDGVINGNIYTIDAFALGELVYPHLPVIACEDEDSEFSMLLSATMFDRLILSLDFKEHKALVQLPDGESIVRNIVITKNGKKLVLANG